MNKKVMSKLERQNYIHEKGFDFGKTAYKTSDVVDYSKARVGNGGNNRVEDVSVNLRTALNQLDTPYTDKSVILQAIYNKNTDILREISDFYFDISGIYKRACEYIAFLYRYDHYVYQKASASKKKINKEKALERFYTIADYLDKSNLKHKFNAISLEIIKHGCYYGYKIDSNDQLILQDLPSKYCRSKYYVNGVPAVEFNMKFFTENFRDTTYREKILNIFPKDFRKGYELYKKNLLPPETAGEDNSWYLLDPKHAVKFNLNNSDIPFLVDSIPTILDLEEAREIDRKKMMQQLMKVLVQKLPLDKNGELVFDVDEAKDLHANAVAMLGDMLGVDVLTTFADIRVEDMDTTTTATANADSLAKVERAVYNQLGFSKNLFNTEGNTALEKSIADDEAVLKNLLWQYETFVNNDLDETFNKEPYIYRAKFLETTIYNYKDLSKLYKEQTMLGLPRFLPLIALGHTQSEIISELKFEQEVLDVSKIMVPPQMSSTMSNKNDGKDKTGKDNQNNNQNIVEDEKSPGRKELPDDEKSDKTLANREALG